MSLNNKCDTPRITVIKRIISYFDEHPKQATMIFGALSIGFVIAVMAVGSAMVLQAQHGCLTFFTRNYDAKDINGS